MGDFDKAFLDVPAECLMTSMKKHQKCFSLRHPARSSRTTSCWSPTSCAKDGGKKIVAGNEKVIAARLSDAKFFWEQDLKKPLERWRARSTASPSTRSSARRRSASSASRSWRSRSRARSSCAGGRAARGAARQGRPRVGHGRRVPRAAGADGPLLRRGRGTKPEIARAIELHYKPKGPTDSVPLVERGRRRRGRRGAGRQARHAGRLLGHRREADRLRRSLSAPPRRAGRHPHRAGE